MKRHWFHRTAVDGMSKTKNRENKQNPYNTKGLAWFKKQRTKVIPGNPGNALKPYKITVSALPELTGKCVP